MEALNIPVKLYVHYHLSTFSQNKFIVSVCDMSRHFPDQYVLLETHNINIAVNQPEPLDLIALQVDRLRAQKEEIAKLAQRQTDMIDDQIQQLLCIDHSHIEDSDIPF